MVISTSAISTPVGAIKSWIRPDNTTALPFGWLICDGSTVSDSDSSFDGKAIPDLRSQFSRGHATLTNANFGADALYFTGGTVPTGGANAVNLSHTHTGSNHNHTFSVVTSSNGPNGSFFNSGGGDTTNAPHTHTLSGTSGSTSTTTSSAGNGASENRPAYIEILTIIKVK